MLFIAINIGGALSTSAPMLITFLFLGSMSVVSLTLYPSVVGNLFVTEQRGHAMAIMGLTSILGVVSGPGCGLMPKFWLSAILCAALKTALLFIYRKLTEFGFCSGRQSNCVNFRKILRYDPSIIKEKRRVS